MKHCSTLVFILVCLLGHAQEPFFAVQTHWENPHPTRVQLKNANISSILVESYERSSRRARPVASTQQVFTYNQEGLPTDEIVLSAGGTDTLKKIAYTYNGNGSLWRKSVSDYVSQRSYRSGYRCTRDQRFYQVRSYELLQDASRMLLSSRQYYYRDGNVEAIELRENNRVVQTHRFSYNEQGQVVEERFETADGELIKSVSYLYNEQGLISEVAVQEARGLASVYRYDYYEFGLPKQVEWMQGEVRKGLAMYQYNAEGLLTDFNRVLYPNTPQQKSVLKKYRYDLHPEGAPEPDSHAAGIAAAQ